MTSWGKHWFAFFNCHIRWEHFQQKEINITIQRSEHEKPLLVDNLSEIIFQNCPVGGCRPERWIFKAGFDGCFWQLIQGLAGSFASDFSFAVSSANLPNNLLNKCLGSPSFLCSAFTWMQIRLNLTSAGTWSQPGTYGMRQETLQRSLPSWSTHQGNVSAKGHNSASYTQIGVCRRAGAPADWEEKRFFSEITSKTQSSCGSRWLQPGNRPSRFIPLSLSWHSLLL